MTDVNIIRGDTMKAGDTLPALRVKLLDDGDPFNLTNYDVDIRVRRSDGDGTVVDTDATIDIANRGIVEYSWSPGETDEPGTYLVEFVADDGSGSTMTFPNLAYAKVYIEERL